MKRREQTGSLLTLILLGLVAAGVLATIAYGSYYQIARGTQDTVLRSNASALLTQAAYTLATESQDSDVVKDGITEPPAGLIALNDGWEIPASSGAPKVDSWGSPIKYCAWDNGGTNSSAGRLTGANPALPSSVQFALISAGPDKTFDTSCALALTGVAGDDGRRVMTVAQLNQGVGGTYFYGDPVLSKAALPQPPDYSPPNGMLRITLDTGIPYWWNGNEWLPLTVAAQIAATGASCTSYLAGTLGRDTNDDLHICTSTARIWKKVGTP